MGQLPVGIAPFAFACQCKDSAAENSGDDFRAEAQAIDARILACEIDVQIVNAWSRGPYSFSAKESIWFRTSANSPACAGK